jgi:hypothetical protein
VTKKGEDRMGDGTYKELIDANFDTMNLIEIVQCKQQAINFRVEIDNKILLAEKAEKRIRQEQLTQQEQLKGQWRTHPKNPDYEYHTVTRETRERALPSVPKSDSASTPSPVDPAFPPNAHKASTKPSRKAKAKTRSRFSLFNEKRKEESVQKILSVFTNGESKNIDDIILASTLAPTTVRKHVQRLTEEGYLNEVDDKSYLKIKDRNPVIVYIRSDKHKLYKTYLRAKIIGEIFTDKEFAKQEKIKLQAARLRLSRAVFAGVLIRTSVKCHYRLNLLPIEFKYGLKLIEDSVKAAVDTLFNLRRKADCNEIATVLQASVGRIESSLRIAAKNTLIIKVGRRHYIHPHWYQLTTPPETPQPPPAPPIDSTGTLPGMH